MFNPALAPEQETNKENIISQDYNLLSDNNPNVMWEGGKFKLRRPNGLSNPKKLKFRSFQTELLPYTSLELPQLKTELYLTTSTDADSVTVGGKYNRFGIGPLLKTEYNTSDNKSEVLDSFTKAWTYNADYNSQIDYNIKECIDFANIRLNEWIQTVGIEYTYKQYNDYVLREYENENIGILPKYNYSDSICSIVGNKVAIATYNDDTNQLEVKVANKSFNRVSNCCIICASSNRKLIYAVGTLNNNRYSYSKCYYLRNSDKKYIHFLDFLWGWNSDTYLMPTATVGCTMSKNYSLINAANSSGEGWRRGLFCLMYHGDVNDNPPATYEFQDTVIGTFPNHEVVCLAIAETYSTEPNNFYALFANYNKTTKKVDLYFGQIRIESNQTISYTPMAIGTMELDYWNSNKFMDCAMGMSFDDELSFVASANDGVIYNFSNKVMFKLKEGEILDVKRYYNYKSFNYQDPDNKYCCFGGLAGPGEERNFCMVKESDMDTATIYNQGYIYSEILITTSQKPIYSFGSNAGFVQTNKEDGVQTTGGIKGNALYTEGEKRLINLRDGAYIENEQTYGLANQYLNYATTTPGEGKLINIVDNNIIHPQLLFGDDKVANIGMRIYTDPYYFEVFHDDNYYASALYSLYPVTDTMQTHFINSHVYNTLETIILMQYEYNDLMLRVSQFPNNDNVVFSSGDIARVAFKVMNIDTTTEFLNCELATNDDDAITKDDLKRIYGKVTISCDWIQ